jgi:DNA primase
MYGDLRSRPLREVLALLGFSEWKERKNGSEWYGKCPVHQGNNRGSFSFDSTGRFNCFSCACKGRGAIDLTMAVRGIGFQEAVELLKGLSVAAESLNRPAPNHLGRAGDMVVDNPPFKGQYEKFAVPSAWLKERGLTPEALARYEVFEYNNPARKSVYSGSVMLKIRRWSDGECVGYLSRNIGEITPAKPKYCFPKGVQKSLEVFGACQIKNEATLPLRVVYLVESPFCVLKFWQLGFAAVSCFGWSVSVEQAAILRYLAKGYIYLPDSDKSNEIGNSLLTVARSCWVKTPLMPEGVSDPEQLTAEQIRSLTA